VEGGRPTLTTPEVSTPSHASLSTPLGAWMCFREGWDEGDQIKLKNVMNMMIKYSNSNNNNNNNNTNKK